MKEVFSIKNILQSLLIFLLVTIFTRVYLIFITIDQITTELDSILSVVRFVIYVVIWLALVLLAFKVTNKIIPTKKKSSNESS